MMMEERKLEPEKQYWTLWYSDNQKIASRGGWYIAIYDESSVKHELDRANKLWLEVVCKEMGVRKEEIEKSNEFPKLFALYREQEGKRKGMITKTQIMYGSDFKNIPIRISKGGISLCLFFNGTYQDAGKYLSGEELT